MAAKPAVKGRQPGGRIPNLLPGSSSPDTNCWQRPNSCTMFTLSTLSKFNKYSGQQGSGTLKGHLTGGGSKGCWKISTLPQQLVKGDPRSMGLKDSARLQVRVTKGTCTDCQPQRAADISSRTVSSKRRFKICCRKKP